MSLTLERQTGFVLIQLDDAGTQFLLLDLLVNGGNVLVDEKTTVTQIVTELQRSQAEAANELLRLATKLTSLQIRLAEAGVIPDESAHTSETAM